MSGTTFNARCVGSLCPWVWHVRLHCFFDLWANGFRRMHICAMLCMSGCILPEEMRSISRKMCGFAKAQWPDKVFVKVCRAELIVIPLTWILKCIMLVENVCFKYMWFHESDEKTLWNLNKCRERFREIVFCIIKHRSSDHRQFSQFGHTIFPLQLYYESMLHPAYTRITTSCENVVYTLKWHKQPMAKSGLAWGGRWNLIRRVIRYRQVALVVIYELMWLGECHSRFEAGLLTALYYQ